MLLRALGPLLLVAVEYQTEEELLDAGPLQVQTRSRESIEIPPLAAGLIAAAGGALTALAFRRRS